MRAPEFATKSKGPLSLDISTNTPSATNAASFADFTVHDSNVFEPSSTTTTRFDGYHSYTVHGNELYEPQNQDRSSTTSFAGYDVYQVHTNATYELDNQDR